jgi:hypothetical protein
VCILWYYLQDESECRSEDHVQDEKSLKKILPEEFVVVVVVLIGRMDRRMDREESQQRSCWGR